MAIHFAFESDRRRSLTSLNFNSARTSTLAATALNHPSCGSTTRLLAVLLQVGVNADLLHAEVKIVGRPVRNAREQLSETFPNLS